MCVSNHYIHLNNNNNSIYNISILRHIGMNILSSSPSSSSIGHSPDPSTRVHHGTSGGLVMTNTTYNLILPSHLISALHLCNMFKTIRYPRLLPIGKQIPSGHLLSSSYILNVVSMLIHRLVRIMPNMSQYSLILASISFH